MILTCPECASRYFVDDARVGTKGRTVRCASCAHSWRAMPEPSPFDEPPLTLAPTAEDTPEPERPAPLPIRIRAEAVEKKKSREAVAAGVIWAGLGAGFVSVVLAAALFRVDVVRLWPQTAGAYAFARMPVNPTGLALEGVQGQPNLIEGHAALSVTAQEHNVDARPHASIPIRVILYDKAGKRLTSAVAAPPTREIAPGESRPFAVNFIDPPAAGADIVVAFAFDKIAAAPARATAGAGAGAGAARQAAGQKLGPGGLALRGSAGPNLTTASSQGPVQAPLRAEAAKPLPAGSPYALPVAASAQAAR